MSSPREAVAGGTFELLRRWNEYLEVSAKANANTRKQYRRAVIGFLADTLLELGEVTEDDVISFIASKPPQGGSRGMYLRALHSFYRWAERRHVLPDNPVRALPIPREKYGKAPTLTTQERERLYRAAERIDPRARPTIELMFATGARIGSICGLTVADRFTGSNGRPWLHFAIAKDDRPYDVPLNALGMAAFDRLLELRSYRPKRAARRLPTLVGVGPGSVWAWVNRSAETAGLRAWPHLLRHTFATELEDVDDRTWAALMNHRDASLRRRYAAPKDERMEAAVDALV